MFRVTEAYRLLLVEDDARLAALVSSYLAPHGFSVAVETRGDRAAARILSERPDVVLLDIMLPGKDGLSVCREVRGEYRGILVMLTARGDEIDEIVGLEIGADDYLAKPVRPRVLLARLRSLLRRTTDHGEVDHVSSRIEHGALVLDARKRVVTLRGEEVALTTAEFDLLWVLAVRAGRVVTREELFASLRGAEFDGLDRSIDLRISRLRKKLGDDPKQPKRLKSVRGAGYLLCDEP